MQLNSIVTIQIELSIEKLREYKWLKSTHKDIKVPKGQVLRKTKTKMSLEYYYYVVSLKKDKWAKSNLD